MDALFSYIQNLQVFEYVLMAVFVTIVVCSLILSFKNIKTIKRAPKYSNQEENPVSIILIAKNMEFFLRNNLIYFLEQKHNNFEVIVVCDEDETSSQSFLEVMSNKFDNLRCLTLNWELNKHKNDKFASLLAVRVAKYDHVLLSDISAKPLSDNWLSEMSKAIYPNKKAVIGLCSIEKNSGLNNIWQRFDNFKNSLDFVVCALKNKVYNGDLRNIIFEKKFLLDIKGVSKFFCLLKNNDSYAISKIKTPNSVSVSLEKDSILLSDEENVSFGDWFKRKREYLKHFRKLKSRDPNYGLNFLFYVLFAASCVLFFMDIEGDFAVNLITLLVISVFFLLKVILYSLHIRRLMLRFNEKMSIFSIMFCCFLSIFIYPLVRMTVIFSRL